MKTSELTGAQLNYWVARANGRDAKLKGDYCCIRDKLNPKKGYSITYFASEHWSIGGPIIEREQESIDGEGAGGLWRAQGTWKSQLKRGGWVCDGDTPLIAAMRCFVASKYGDTVPDE